MIPDDAEECANCDGTGEVPDQFCRPRWCSFCEGRGWAPREMFGGDDDA